MHFACRLSRSGIDGSLSATGDVSGHWPVRNDDVTDGVLAAGGPSRRGLARAGAAAFAIVAIGLAASSAVTYRPASFPARRVQPAPAKVLLRHLDGRYLSHLSFTSQQSSLAGTPMLPASDVRSCHGLARTWQDAQPSVWVMVATTRCGSIESAREAQWWANEEFRRSYGQMHVRSVVPGAIQGIGEPFLGWPAGHVQVIDLRRGSYFVQVAAFLAASRSGDVTTVVRSVARQQWRVLSGPSGPGGQSFAALVTDELAASAVVAFALAMLIRLLVVAGLTRGRLPPAKRAEWWRGEPGVIQMDVTRQARAAVARADVAACLWLTAAYCGVVALTIPQSATAAAILAAIAAAAFAGALSFMASATRGVRPRRRQPLGPAEALWCVLAAAMYALGTLGLALAVDLAGIEPAMLDGRLDPTITMNEALGRWVAVLPLRLAAADAMVISVLLVAVGYLSARQGCRTLDRAIRRRDATAAADVVFLPAAGDQRLMLRAGIAGRRPLPSRLTFRSSEPFQDVVARLLARGGVVRVDQSGMPGLAAKTLVAIDAAPPADTGAISPELADPRLSQHLDRVLLVFPPVSEEEIYARWEIFRARNCHVRLPAIGVNTGRLLVLRLDPTQGWFAWHARRRTDAAYAAALSSATVPRIGTAWHEPPVAVSPPAGPAGPAGPAPAPWTALAPDLAGAAHLAVTAAAGPEPGPAAQAADVPPGEPSADGYAGHRTVHSPDSVPHVPPWPRRYRTWLVSAGVILALLTAVNVLSARWTRPKPSPVAATVRQDILPPNALGRRFAPAGPAGLRKVPLGGLASRGATCAQRRRTWSDGRARIEIELTGCWPPSLAEITQERIDRSARRDGATSVSGIRYAVESARPTGSSGTADQTRKIVFREGGILAVAELRTPSAPTSLELTTFLGAARRQADDLGGAPGPGLSRIGTAGAVSVAISLFASCLVLIALAVMFVSWLTRRRMLAPGTSPRLRSGDRVIATDVHGRARRVAWLARGRVIGRLGGLCLLDLALQRSNLVLAGCGTAIFVGVMLIRPQGAVRPLRTRFKSGVITGKRTVSALSLVALSLVSAFLAVNAAFVGFLAWSLRASDIVLSYGRVDPGLLGTGALATVVGSVPLPVLSVDCLAIAAVAALTVPATYLAARRRAVRTADELSRGVGDGPREGQILYLRNFADDDIRMPTSRLSRNSIIERIAVYRLERFEEVLVRHLSVTAPVVAVDPSGVVKQPIGAARITLTAANWNEEIKPHIERARLIVVGAAPERQTDGLRWELDWLAHSGALAKTLLVLPPLQSSRVTARWVNFVDMARAFLLPPDLTLSADRLLILAREEQGTWRAWHSRKRTEWDYNVALREAVDTAAGREGSAGDIAV